MSRFAAWLWALSAGLAALVFTFAPQPIIVWCIIVSIVVLTGHNIAPIALAWLNAGFRRIMLDQPVKYLLLPAGTFGLALALPFRWVSVAFIVWNAYHYGMQNYGVLSLVRRPKRRRLAMGGCLVVTGAPMLALAFLPHPNWGWLLVLSGAMNYNHWTTDIGLSGRVSRYGWWFVIGILVIGCIGFVSFEPTLHGELFGWFTGEPTLHKSGFHRRSDDLMQLAWAVGFVHFLYSGGLPGLRMGVWRMSDSRVWATIGAGFSGGWHEDRKLS